MKAKILFLVCLFTCVTGCGRSNKGGELNNPSHRPLVPEQIGQGLNIKAKCKNSNCASYNKMVWVNKGLGFFNMGEKVTSLSCPVCHKTTEPGINAAFYMCGYQIDGKMMGSKENLLDANETHDTNKYITYNDDDQVDWEYLHITVTK